MTVHAGLEISASMEDLHKKVDKINNALVKDVGHVNQVPITGTIPISAGAGSLDSGTQFEPTSGTIWSVRRLTAFGYSAGTVTAFLNAFEPVVPFANAGVFTFGRGELLLYPNERLTFTATGITLNAGILAVQIWGRADWFLADYLSEYLD